MLLVFGNYWQHFGGTDQYNKWSYEAGHGRCDGQFDCRDDFFGDPYAISLYKVRTKPAPLSLHDDAVSFGCLTAIRTICVHGRPTLLRSCFALTP